MDNLYAIAIEGGEAIHMGGGAVAFLQDSDEGPQSVVVSMEEIQRLLAAWG